MPNLETQNLETEWVIQKGLQSGVLNTRDTAGFHQAIASRVNPAVLSQDIATDHLAKLIQIAQWGLKQNDIEMVEKFGETENQYQNKILLKNITTVVGILAIIAGALIPNKTSSINFIEGGAIVKQKWPKSKIALIVAGGAAFLGSLASVILGNRTNEMSDDYRKLKKLNEFCNSSNS